jgi:hypothetical protein
MKKLLDSVPSYQERIAFSVGMKDGKRANFVCPYTDGILKDAWHRGVERSKK